MRFVKRDSPGGTPQRWEHAEELELGAPMEEPLVSVESSGARRDPASLPREGWVKGELSQLPEGR